MSARTRNGHDDTDCARALMYHNREAGSQDTKIISSWKVEPSEILGGAHAAGTSGRARKSLYLRWFVVVCITN